MRLQGFYIKDFIGTKIKATLEETYNALLNT